MLQKAILIAGLSAILLGCGGEDITSFVEVTDTQLSSLEVVEGGTLQFADNAVEEFNPSIVGPYSVELADQTLTEITLRATTDRPDELRLELVEFDRGDDGDDRVTAISSGEMVTVPIVEGANVVAIRVSDRSLAARVEYVLQISRVSSSVVLRDVVVANVGSASENELVQFSDEVSSDIFAYDVTLSSTVCNASFLVQPEAIAAEVRVNGVRQAPNEATYFALEENVTLPVVVEITAEDGTVGPTYTFNLTRAAAGAEEISADTTLRSLNFSQGRALDAFRCNDGDVTQLVSESVTSIAVTAAPSRSGAAIRLAAVPEDGSCSTDLADEEFVELIAGEPFAGELLNALEVGSNAFCLAVTAEDGEAERVYGINIVRSENHQVYVTNAAELQQALRTAAPNDEIVIAAGDYLGAVSDTGSPTGSGHPNAHFFSDASGGAGDQRIIVRPESGAVSLLGDNLNANAVLHLQGDNWHVIGLEISGAQNGIVLDGADNVLIELATLRDFGERAVVMQNGSFDNQVRGGAIDRTGRSPLAREGIAEVYGEAIVIGHGQGGGSNNRVRNVRFGRNIATEAVDVRAGVSGTAIQYNVFDLDNTLAAPVADRTTITMNGSAEISYNQFEFNYIAAGTDDIAQIIAVSAADNDLVEIFENLLNLDDQAVTFVSAAGAGQVSAASNFVGDRELGVEAIYVGGVDQEFSLPTYQIQSTLDSGKCLARREVDVTVDGVVTALDLAVALDCDSAPAQQWRFIHDEEGFVSIALASDRAVKMLPFSLEGILPSDRAQVLAVREDQDNNFDSAFSLRWLVVENEGGYSFANRAEVGQFLFEDAEFTAEDVEFEIQPLFVDLIPTDVVSDFTLIRQ